MKEIRLKRLRLLNFKGTRNLEVDFDADRTTIYAANGKGKSTLFDAFSWLLFGKDRKGRKPSGKGSFGLKTYDSNGVTIPRISHEVEALMEVSGEPVMLRRTFNEKWTKKKGELTECFDGNEEERFFNEVPCSLEEWSAKIASLCSEATFRLITSPYYFNDQKMEVKRKMLIQMAGGISDREIAEGNDSFVALLALLGTDKTLDDLKREVISKKARIKKEVDSIPGRIDEQKREMPEIEDWDKISSEISEKENEVKEIDGQLMSDAKRQEERNKRDLERSRKLFEIQGKIQRRGQEITDEAFASYRQYHMTCNSLISEKKDLGQTVERAKTRIADLEKEYNSAKSNRDKMLKEFEGLKDKVKQIKSEQLSFSENDFRCPTCGRTFEPDQIEAKQSEMLARFEEQRQVRLDAATSEKNENIARGKRNNDNMAEILKEIGECRQRIENAENRIAEIDKSDALTKNLTPPDAAPLIDADATILKLRAEERELTDNDVQGEEDDETLCKTLSGKKETLNQEIKDLRERAFKRDEIDRRNKRITELQNQLQNQNQELFDLEKLEYTISAFTKARIEAVEDKINSMFDNVRFRLFSTQVNGAEIETCDAMFNGVPYTDCSHAEMINMGLDIINAISRSKGVTAPIFIDNAESICEVLPTEAQTIRLVVSPGHDTLTVVNG